MRDTWNSAARAARTAARETRPARAASALPAALIAVSLGLTGCGGDADSDSMTGTNHGSPSTSATSGPGVPTGDFNDADVAFATKMIPHHQQAVQMSEMAIRKAGTAQLRALAARIKAAQGPEVAQLSGWLTGWGKPVPSQSHGGHSGHDSEMPGMMTEDQLDDLGNTDGAAFDRLWTQLMIEHHQGAVTMSRTEQTAGQNPVAVALAKKIETDQNREIVIMRRMLAQRPSR